MVREGVTRWETLVIHRTGAANCTCGLPVTGRSRIVDHTERIDRSFLRRHRFVYPVRSGESRLGNDRRGLYQRPLGRRLAESSALFHHLPRFDLHRRWQVLNRLLTANQKAKTAPRVGVLIDLRHFTLIIRSAPCLRQLPWLRCRLPARLKLTRCPRSFAATLAALPSMSLIPQLHSLTGDVFYVAFPKSSIPFVATCSMLRVPGHSLLTFQSLLVTRCARNADKSGDK